ncbi:hypothetical protein [Candidatus Tisiphia endosymbiont of Oplodontha viridula]|uniref:hypothetical protein n=1 Tax=Candidatus Tisiphia endosymbiont of Oplodontha viridula TaxID=3077925 RepID=UPI0035C905CA
MADDFDDDKGKKKDMADFAQFENAINDVKSQIHSTNPAELARLNASIASLLSSNLPSEILSKLKDLQAVVSEREERAEQVVRYTQEEQSREAEEARLLQEHIEFLEKEAKIANEVREQELKQHFEDFNSIKDEAHKQEQEDIALLAQAAKDPNSLTAAQRAQLMGQYATNEEKEEAEKKQQQMKKNWEMYYAIKNKTNETIAYKQSKIKANDTIINHPATHEPEKKKRRQENVVLEQEIVNHQQKLEESTTEFTQDREQKREKILALVNSDQPELAVEMLKVHHKLHGKDYEQERQENPNHQGYNELHSMIIALGGHEKLGLPKPKYPIVEQQIPSTQNMKASAIEHQAESIEKPAIQNLQERVESIKKGLERQQSSNNKSQNSKVNSPTNNHQAQDETNPPKPKSRFAQNLKKMEGRG